MSGAKTEWEPETTRAAVTEHKRLAMIEALLFAAGDPVDIARLAKAAGETEEEAARLVEELGRIYTREGHAIMVQEVAGGFRLCTRPEFAPNLAALAKERQPTTLSQAALETLAVIAYRQPATRAEVEAIRGVRAESAIGTLVEKGLVKELGRKDVIGRPILFGTTPFFLQYLGLKDLSELPDIEQFGAPGENNSPPDGAAGGGTALPA